MLIIALGFRFATRRPMNLEPGGFTHAEEGFLRTVQLLALDKTS